MARTPWYNPDRENEENGAFAPDSARPPQDGCEGLGRGSQGKGCANNGEAIWEKEKEELAAMPWAEPAYSRTQINKSGKALIDPAATADEIQFAEAVINNWRSAHGLPLLWLSMDLRRLAAKVDDHRIVAQRIKRLASIKLKLSTQGHMDMARMQDIAGCRAIVKSTKDVKRLAKLFQGSRMHHTLYDTDDYLKHPKPSGYQAIHLKYKYQSERYVKHCGLSIEVQLRSQLQHTWATAVEMVGLFTEQALKSSLGDSDWLRFFALMGAVTAKMEKGVPVPNTPTSLKDLTDELRAYEAKLSALTLLRGYGTAVRLTVPAAKKTGHPFFLLTVDANTKNLTWQSFGKDQSTQAATAYLAAERKIEGKPGMQTVLVSVERIKTLQRAYPSYFLDTTAFDKLVTDALNPSARRLRAG
ncbi:MAG TPA: RelA/SpoT domain-containing protein [Candidatus Eremiobacteraceae bacterium]|nr:RelA/SpoT domain-containing protein [Candidatus Eremiobacteraceae bacterium]